MVAREHRDARHAQSQTYLGTIMMVTGPVAADSLSPDPMTATAILKVFFGAGMVLVSVRQLLGASSKTFASGAERVGYYFGTVGFLALAVWLIVSGLRSRKGSGNDGP
jgi:hypothetical protein